MNKKQLLADEFVSLVNGGFYQKIGKDLSGMTL